MKKYLLGFFAIVLAIGLSAFTSKSSSNEYFPYDEDATHYYVTTIPGLSCNVYGPVVCKIITNDTLDAQNRVLISSSTPVGRKN